MVDGFRWVRMEARRTGARARGVVRESVEAMMLCSAMSVDSVSLNNVQCCSRLLLHHDVIIPLRTPPGAEDLPLFLLLLLLDLHHTICLQVRHQSKALHNGRRLTPRAVEMRPIRGSCDVCSPAKVEVECARPA